MTVRYLDNLGVMNILKYQHDPHEAQTLSKPEGMGVGSHSHEELRM